MPRERRTELTPRRRAILDYITRTVNERGYPPTVREIGEAVGLSSPSSVFFHINALVDGGYLEKDSSKTRALRPAGAKTHPGSQAARYVPIVGRVAAGQPLLAVENIETMAPLPGDMFAGDDLFVLRVEGDSMIEAGILDGDMLIVNKKESSDNGDVVVALVEDEATVKRLYVHSDHIELRPANATMEPIRVSDVQIVGKVVGLLRTIR